jgi:tetratricopeptide (TPR) repeat protein
MSTSENEINTKATKTGKELERRVADAYRQIGARKVEHDVELAGHQIDVYVELVTSDRSLHRIAVEAKDYTTPVGIKIVSDFSDIVDRLRRERLIDEGVVVSSAGFSRPARNAAEAHGLRLLEPADLDAMIAQAEAPPSLHAVPQRQLPHNLRPRSEFVGREAEKARVHEALQSRSYLISIDGIGGIGKTSLALELAYKCLHASKGERPTDDVATFDGFIWATAKDHNLTLNALLDAIARTLEYPGIAQQLVEEKQIGVQRLLQEKPYLLIVDNFETITDDGVRDFLLNLPEPSKALITTREQKLRQVWAISLKGLAKPEALVLIRSEGRRLGLVSLERAEDRVLLHLYQATGGAPLAIKWAVGQIKQKGQSLDTVLSALHEARGSIFDNIFTRSWDILSADARQVLMVMPIFATYASLAGTEAASDVHHFALDEVLGQLVEMSLVDATDELDLARRRYSIHPLTRAFAEAKLKQEPETNQATRQRLAEFYRLFTEEHGGFRYQEGFIHLETDLANILDTIRWCWEQGLTEIGINILHNIRGFMVIRGYWNDMLTLGQQAIEQAAEMGDEVEVARWRIGSISWVHRHRGDLKLAEEHAVGALSVFERFGDEGYIAYTKRSLGRIAQERGDFERAEELLREALAYYQTEGDENDILFVTSNIAENALKRGDLDTAWSWGNNALTSARQLNDPERIGHQLKILGGVARQRGDLQQARELWQEALSHFKRAKRVDEIADVLFGLSQIEIGMGETREARRRLSEALETYRRLDIQSRVQDVEAILAELPEPMYQTESEEGHQANEE